MKQFKLYVPLVTTKGKGPVLLNHNNLLSLKDVVPSSESIQRHLYSESLEKSRIDELNKNALPFYQKKYTFKPLVIPVSKEKFEAIEKEIKKMKPFHRFFHKAIDLIIDSSLRVPVVQICIE
jgi:hypothetical protein